MATMVLAAADLRGRIAAIPRVRLAFLPTPIQHCPNLSKGPGRRPLGEAR